MKKPIYFDFNATTPLDAAVREAMLPCLGEEFGNPSSIHQVGRRSRALLDEARERAAMVLGSKPSEIIFTSGGTESVNRAIFGCARLRKHIGKHIVTSAVEQHAVLHSCDYLGRKEGFEVTVLPVDAEGRIVAQGVAKAIRSDTILVSIMAANNETGTIQPISEIGAICRQRGVLFHTDAVQWFGKQPFQGVQQFDADLVSVCGHKFHGPKGTGLLYARSPLLPDPILFGGGHENERRAGTENLAGAVGLVEALERFVKSPVFAPDALRPMRGRLLAGLARIQGVNFVGARNVSLANTISFVV